ncbi:hypothetical protein BSKO_13550 [Bryopsis sp. KO-2023]|nr:hypothetical protein BSKO_13550 [Bryopsis sp. KO-2023]
MVKAGAMRADGDIDCRSGRPGMKNQQGRKSGDRPWEAPGAPQDSCFIEKRISGARNPANVFKIVEGQGFCMTEDNLTSAFTRLATLAETFDQKCEVLKAPGFTEMILTAAQNARIFQPEQLANIMWAMAKLGAQPTVEVMDTMIYASYQMMEETSLGAITTALWAMARLDYIPGEKVLNKAVEVMEMRFNMDRPIPSMSVTEAVWALAAMGHRPSDMFLKTCTMHVMTGLQPHQPEPFPAFDLAQLMWAYVRLGFSPGEEALRRVCQKAMDTLEVWSADAIALLGWSLAKLDFVGFPPALLRAGIERFSVRMDCAWPALTRMISASATFCEHPGEEFLKNAVRIFNGLAHSMYSEAIESVLFSFATFSFHPGFELLDKFAKRVMESPSVFSPLHLANILWCFGLFEFCNLDLWNVVVKEIASMTDSQNVKVPHTALYRLHQVYLLKLEQPGFVFPSQELLQACVEVWNEEIRKQKSTPSALHQEVGKYLSKLLQQGAVPGKLYQKFTTQDGALCLEFYTDQLNQAIDLIELKDFTRNTQMPIGSAIMQTRIIQTLLDRMGSKTIVVTIEAAKWNALETEEHKTAYLRTALSKPADRAA